MTAPLGMAEVLSGMARVSVGLVEERRSQQRGALEELLSAHLGERALLQRLLALSPEDPAWSRKLATCERAIAELAAQLGLAVPE